MSEWMNDKRMNKWAYEGMTEWMNKWLNDICLLHINVKRSKINVCNEKITIITNK